MNQLPGGLYQFGPFCLDRENRLLLRDGVPVPLKPKVFDTLLVLVEQNGRVLSKDELMRRIWPDTAVEENNLTQNISALRKILGESTTGHKYIQTIPRRGYRFCFRDDQGWQEDSQLVLEKHTRSRVVIQEHRTEDQTKATDLSKLPKSADALRSRKRLMRSIVAGAVVLTGLFLSVLYWIFTSRPQGDANSDAPPLRVVQLATWKSATRQAGARNGAFSRDGRMIAFSSNKGGYSSIWIKQVASGDAIEIMGDEWHNESPLWSPDSQQIAFVSNRGNQFGIWTVPVLGGTQTQLKSLGAGWPQLSYWSKGGTTIYYELNSNLFAFDLPSRQITRVTNFDESRSVPAHFSVSPAEDRIAYADLKDGQKDIWIIPMQGGEPVQLTDDAAEDSHPVWHPDGQSIIYSSYSSGTHQICLAYLDSHNSRQITFGDTGLSVLDISPGGGQILYIASREESEVFRVNIDTGEETELTFDLGLELWPDISPDGKTLAFQATSAKDKMYNSLLRVKTPEPEAKAREVATDGFDPRWSPDCSKLGFLRLTGELFNIWIVNSTGGDEKQLTAGGIQIGGFTGLPYNRMQSKNFCWSPDSSKIAYCSRKSGQPNVWVVSADGSSDNRITSNKDASLTFLCPLWSPDGNRIAYFAVPGSPAADGKRLDSICVTEQENSRVVFQSDSILRLVGWSQSGDNLLVALVERDTKSITANTRVSLVEVSITSGESRQRMSIPTPYFTNIRLSPDGLTTAYVSRSGGVDNLWMRPVSGGQGKKLTKNTAPATYLSSLTWSPDGKEIYYTKQEGWSLISMVDNFKSR